MATPEVPRDDLVKYLKQLEARLAAVEKKDPFINSGFAVTGPGVVECDNTFNVVGTENVSGNLNVTGSQTVGGSMTVSGNEVVSGTLNVTGNTVIGGTLSLPNGIINNAALANPVTASSAHASGDSFALATGANVTKAGATVVVPSGFTQALVQAFAAISAWNPNSSADTLFLGCRINNPAGVDQNTGWSMSHTVPASSQGAIAESSTALMTGLTAGQTFTVQATASTNSLAWASSGSNVANIDATIIWLR